jgi:hypothetical protein
MRYVFSRNGWISLTLLFLYLAIVSCNSGSTSQGNVSDDDDPLQSWNETSTKEAIVEFIERSVDESGPYFIPENERVAVFDNDGTLWSEQPYYFQLQFAIDRIKQLAPEHPEWNDTQPFKAVLEDDLEHVMESGVQGLLQLVMGSHAGMDNREFNAIVSEWIRTARHPQTGKLYKEMVFQPMLELLEYFRASDFKTYIVSGGGIDFMRPWTEEVYGIPPEQVIGSSIKKRYGIIDGEPAIMRLPEMDFIDDKEGKPLGIDKFIGKRPVAAFGNSDGDLQMLQWTAAGDGNRLMVYIHHTDSVREWAYDRDSHIGKLDKGLDEAMEKGWLVVDMADDWKMVYPDSE